MLTYTLKKTPGQTAAAKNSREDHLDHERYENFPAGKVKKLPVHRTGSLFVLVGHVGQQSNLAGALDGLRQLALMHGAGAGGSAGQNLGALGYKAAQLGGILVVDGLALLSAELADLAALAAGRARGSGFPIKSHEGFLLYFIQSERQLAVLLADLGEVRLPTALRRGCSIGRGTIGGRGAIIPAAIPLGIPKVDVVRDHLGAAALSSIWRA